MIMKKICLKTYLGLLAVFIGSFGCAYFLPINEAFKGIATTPAIGALLVAIYQILKDQAAFERQDYLQRQQQIFNLGATSQLIAGTTLYLPVNAPGGLFSTGDAHAVQGDGEVDMTAIETAMNEAVLQFVVRKDMKLERPMVETPTHWIATGYHKDLNEAVKIALRDAIQFISKTKGLTPEDAYALSSLAVNLRVTQIVDVNKGIHAMIPKAIFKK